MKEEVKTTIGQVLDDSVDKQKVIGSKVRVSRVFLIALSVVSILGFVGIISISFFETNINLYIDAMLMLIIGLALVLEAQVKELKSIAQGLNSTNFSRLITFIIGSLAVIAGFFSLPEFAFENSVFSAVKGILAIIAIVIIIVQTWIVKA